MGLFGGINAVNEINSLIAQIERNMNALAPMIELNGMKHTTQSKELTKLVRRDLDRIKDPVSYTHLTLPTTSRV